MDPHANEDGPLDYEEVEDTTEAAATTEAPAQKAGKGTHVSFHMSGFRDFLLKPELLHAIGDRGFEHPSAGSAFLYPPPVSHTKLQDSNKYIQASCLTVSLASQSGQPKSSLAGPQ